MGTTMPISRLAFLLLVVVLHNLSNRITAFPPPPPLHCSTKYCTISNAYGLWPDRSECRAASVAYPTSEGELISAVSHANRNRLKVKVVTKFSHTIPKLVCPTSTSSSYSNGSSSIESAAMFISTEHLNSGIEVDVEKRVVTADSGIGLRELIDKVEEAGLSVVATPYWDGVSVGGAISTGSVGSSWWGRGGALHDYLVGMDLVVPASEEDGFAKVVRLTEKDPMLKAAKVSLGVLGAISKVKLSLEPAFKRSITYNFTGDEGLEDEYVNHGKTYEFGDITWYPSKRTAVYRYDHRVPLDTPGNGVNDFIGFQPQPVLISKSIRATEKTFESTRNIKGKCTMAATTIAAKKLLANGLKNNNFLFTGYPVIGHQGKMQTSGSCHSSPPSRIDASCPWDPRIKGLSFFESTAIFPSTTFKSFIQDVKKLRDIDPDGFCNIDMYNGFLIRYVRGSEAYLGQPEDEYFVSVDFNYYRADDAGRPRLKEDVMEEVEQMAFVKYGARPHWAKNRPVGFYGVKQKYPNGFLKFLEAKRMMDPNRMFSSEDEEEVLFGKEIKGKFDGCGLEGLCLCSEDRHCSPKDGYYCRHGRVYTEARVCRAGPN